jgi:hypothetical protein
MFSFLQQLHDPVSSKCHAPELMILSGALFSFLQQLILSAANVLPQSC